MEFTQIIRSAKNKSEWVIWLSTDTGKAATETLAFLSVCYSNIPEAKRGSVKRRLRAGNKDEVDAIIRELIAFELLRRLHLQPEWSPDIEGKKPDLMFDYYGERFIADVFLVKSPQKTIEQKSDIFIIYWDKPEIQSESRSDKIAKIIREKSSNYSHLKYPLVLFVFFADNLGLDIQKVEIALYGSTIEEIQNNKNCPVNGYLYPFPPNLVAVIACKWFDTSNLDDEGKRLRCVVLHNWAAKFNLPIGAFSSFGQVFWDTEGETKHPYYIGDPSVVAKFQDDSTLELRPYSKDKYW
jgi:hypothetical protein